MIPMLKGGGRRRSGEKGFGAGCAGGSRRAAGHAGAGHAGSRRAAGRFGGRGFSAPVLPPDERIHYAYGTLAGARRRAYEDLCTALAEAAPKVMLDGVMQAQEAFEVLRMVKADHPEVHWLGSGARVGVTPRGAEVHLDRCPDAREGDDAALRDAADAFLRALPAGADEYTCAKLAFSQVASSVRYDCATRDRTDGGGSMRPYESTGALVDRLAVCAGFAKGVQYLLQQAGMMAVFVSGEARSTALPEDTWGSHAWLAVRIDGGFYHMDPTWSFLSGSDPRGSGWVRYAYFGLTDREIGASHRATTTPFALPRCDATAADYFRREGLCLRVWDAKRYADMVARQLADGGGVASVKAASDAVYAKMTDEILHGDGCWDVLRRASILTGADYRSRSVSFTVDSHLRILTLLVA